MTVVNQKRMVIKLNSFKKILTSWYLWAFIAAIFGFLLFQRSIDLASLAPFALFLICPIMMIFMMGSHKDHKH